MVTYCEGAKAAEILFSLTGGREGRLMSYAPPVEIYVGRGVFFQYKKAFGFPYPGYIATEGITEIDSYRAWIAEGGFGGSTGRFFKHQDNEYIIFAINNAFMQNDSTVGYELWERYLDNGISRDRIKESVQLARMPFYTNTNAGFQVYLGLKSNPKKRALSISDTEGSLYLHEIPEGFTPTWQVNCIGCNPGECAGSDGKGGVVCMDCKQMSNDLQIIKKSLSR